MTEDQPGRFDKGKFIPDAPVKETEIDNRTREAYIRELNNQQLEIDFLKASQLVESYADIDWANRIDRDYLWIRTSGAQDPNFKYITKETVDMYADQVNFMAVYNPLVFRTVAIKTLFTFSRGFQITSKNEEIENFQKDPDPLNFQAFFSHQACSENDAELQKTGNVFFAIWKDSKAIRPWSTYEISDIVRDKEDTARPLFYIRKWLDPEGHEHKKAYPSLYVKDSEIPNGKSMIRHGGKEYEVDQDIRVLQLNTIKPLRAKFALSELISACRWAKPHEKFLEDFGAIVAALRRYTHTLTAPSTGKVSSATNQFKGNTSYMGTPLQTNPPGSLVGMTDGTEFKVVDAGSNKIVGPKDSRYFLNMYCAGSGVPETLLTGDPSTGNLATAKELTGPFLTLIEERQTLWTSAITQIIAYIFDTNEFEVSFPPIRATDALDYINSLLAVATLNSPGVWAGSMDPKDFVTAAYESLDIKLDDETKDKVISTLSGMMPAISPDAAQNLEHLKKAAEALAPILGATIDPFAVVSRKKTQEILGIDPDEYEEDEGGINEQTNE